MDSILTRAPSLLAVLAVVGCALMPARVLADVRMTEIMYDAPSADTGHEWLEITNVGSDAVDVGKYALYESDTNHRLTLATGSTMLVSNQSAILTPSPAVFTADHPSFSGNMYKVSFSLSNTGETIALKNASSTIMDSVTYNSTMGANGNGDSLHRLASGVWQAGEPDPGVYTGTVTALHTKTSKTVAPTTPARAMVPVVATPTTTQSTQVATSKVTAPPAPEQSNSLALLESVLGLVVIILLGVGSVWYAKGVTEKMTEETSPTPEEFDIES